MGAVGHTGKLSQWGGSSNPCFQCWKDVLEERHWAKRVPLNHSRGVGQEEMPCDCPPSFSLVLQIPILHFNRLTCCCQSARTIKQKWTITTKSDFISTSQAKRVLRLTHSEICCCTSPLSDRHQCRGTVSKGELNISVGIGATVVFRNAASRSQGPIHQWVQKRRFHRSMRAMPAAGHSLNCLRKC